ncbi:hypothetical protein ACFQ1M_16685 [Sungkyunkwania multivorans]|uniref:Uncharacterized protein n=1 Tax=Sungkyunkwania multivorans TaxID=1173618 RepID=A0ABW3D414_9FLAO
MKTTCGILPLILTLLLTSCELFQPKESAESLSDKYLESVSWDTLDQYPLFENCEETMAKDAQRNCFENTLFDNLYAELSQQQITVSKTVNDTVMLHFTISKDGILTLDKIDKSPLIEKEIPHLDSLLHASLEKLPSLYAGLKKVATGDVSEMVPVEVSCALPLIIRAF